LTKLSIKRVGPDDLPAFRAVNTVMGSAFGEALHSAGNPPDDHYAVRLLERPEVIVLLAEQNGVPVGALAGYELFKWEQARSEIYIYDLAVIESARRQGVATALIDATRAIARERGAWTVFVQADTVPEDEPARRLYRKLASDEITALHFDIAP
jgi:aminoglycoside 3-N-acetyltransferase I